MPAIGLAAAIIERRDPDAVIGSFAADHVIRTQGEFRDAVREAVAVARTGRIVTIGITPTHASTAFGYIREGASLAVDGAPQAREVAEFVEKPDESTARGYLAEGGFWWNAGMFVARASVLLDALDRYHHDLAAGLRAIAADPSRLDADWAGLEKIAIDHAIAEPAAADGLVAVVPASFSWDDVGDFASLSALVAAGSTRRMESPSSVTPPMSSAWTPPDSSPPAAADWSPSSGSDDVVVIDTPDALLVVARDRAQDVKAVVDRLKASGRDDLT